MRNFVFPLHLSEATGMYQNAFGEFSLETIQKNGSFEFYLTEEKAVCSDWNVLTETNSETPDTWKSCVHITVCTNSLQKTDTFSSVQNAPLDLHYNTFLRRILLW